MLRSRRAGSGAEATELDFPTFCGHVDFAQSIGPDVQTTYQGSMARQIIAAA